VERNGKVEDGMEWSDIGIVTMGRVNAKVVRSPPLWTVDDWIFGRILPKVDGGRVGGAKPVADPACKLKCRGYRFRPVERKRACGARWTLCANPRSSGARSSSANRH